MEIIDKTRKQPLPPTTPCISPTSSKHQQKCMFVWKLMHLFGVGWEAETLQG